MAILRDTLIAGSIGSGRITATKVPHPNDPTKMVDEVQSLFMNGFNGNGWKIYPELNANNQPTGYFCLEVDDIVVRRSMYVFELVIQKIRAVNGAIAVTQGNGKIKTAELKDGYWHITLDDEACPFDKDDFMMYQRFKNNGLQGYYVRVHDVTDDGVILVADKQFSDYKTVQIEDEDNGAWSSVDHPSVGDEVVQMGNKTNTLRQSCIYIHANESDGKPAIDIMNGINSRSAFRSGSAMQVRLGGCLPNQPYTTNGLWVKNGTILSENENGKAYEFNPDGSFMLAAGVITYSQEKGLVWDTSKAPDLKGEAIVPSLSVSTLIAKKSVVEQTFTTRLRVYNNSEAMKAYNPAFNRAGVSRTDGYSLSASSAVLPDGLSFATTYGNDYIDLEFTLAADTAVDFDMPLSVVLYKDGSTRALTVAFRTISDGVKGESGTSFEIKGYAIGLWDWDNLERTVGDEQYLIDEDWKATALYLVNNHPDGYNVVAFDEDRNMTTKFKAAKGDAYVVSFDDTLSQYGHSGNDGHIYSWGDNEWVDLGQIQGADGKNGENGKAGEDAYVIECNPSVVAMEIEQPLTAKTNEKNAWDTPESQNLVTIRVKHGDGYATIMSVGIVSGSEVHCSCTTPEAYGGDETSWFFRISGVETMLYGEGKDAFRMPYGSGSVTIKVAYKTDSGLVKDGDIVIPFTVASTLLAGSVKWDYKQLTSKYDAWTNGEDGRMANYFNSQFTQTATNISATVTQNVNNTLKSSGMYIYADHIDVDATKFNIGEMKADDTFWTYIAIGKDSFGPYFKFLNEDGSEAYNLGFTGLAELIANTTKASFDDGEYYYKISDTPYVLGSNNTAKPNDIMNAAFTNSGWSRFYCFTAQSTINQSTKEKIYAPVGGKGCDGKFYEDNSIIQYLPDADSIAPTGVYATRPMISGTQFLNFYSIDEGKRSMLSSYIIYGGKATCAYLVNGLHPEYNLSDQVPVFQSKGLT